MSSSDLTTIELGPLTSAQRAQLKGDEPNPFDSDGRLEWHPADRHVALAEPGGRLVAVAGTSLAAATVGGTEVALVGIGGVIVRADRRDQGLGLKVVRAALEQAQAAGPDHALLFCRPDRMGFYTRLGFVPVEAPVTVAQPGNERATMHLRAMWHGLSPTASWPAGPVALRGLPF